MNTYKKYVRELDIYNITEEPTEFVTFKTNCPTIQNKSTPTLLPINNISNINNNTNDNNIIIIVFPTIISFIIIIFIIYRLYYLKNKIKKNSNVLLDDNFGTDLNNIVDF
jgi:hypothetical protein